MSKEKIRYFITQNKAGEELPRMQWSSELNACVAMAHPDGVYITATPEVCQILEHMGYTEVDKDYVKTMGVPEPYVPDRIDYTVRESSKYIPYE
jgi:hypothetical protein